MSHVIRLAREEVEAGYVYITATSRCFHSRANCAGLAASVRSGWTPIIVDRDEHASTLRPCRLCFTADGNVPEWMVDLAWIEKAYEQRDQVRRFPPERIPCPCCDGKGTVWRRRTTPREEAA